MQSSNTQIYTAIESSDVPVILEFHGDNCPPCLTQEDLLAHAAGQPGFPARLVNINIDDAPEEAARYNINSVPSVVLMDHGKVVARFDSLIDAGSVISAIQTV